VSASTPTPTQAVQVAVANQGVARAQSAQDLLDSPAWPAFLQLMAPWTRQYGHSAAMGSIGPILIIVAAQFGLTMPQNVSEVLSLILFVGVSYGWQAFSIALGKARAPVQPSTVATTTQ
jgi:hypothetical protein